MPKTLAELRAIEHEIWIELKNINIRTGELFERLKWVQDAIKQLGGYDETHSK